MPRAAQQPPRIPGLIDSHCHLDAPPMANDVAATLRRAHAAGVEQCIHIGCSPDRLAPAVALAEAFEAVFASVGVHPHDADRLDDGVLRRIEQLAAHPKVVAIGETGLDYYYDNAPRGRQQHAFAQQLDLAATLELPAVLHIRDAHADAWDVVAAHPGRPTAPGVVHCFTGTVAEAERWLALGWTLSFSGIATFRKLPELREAARRCPDDRILVETDAPYLAPEPLRGKRNEPANVAFTCARLAEARGETPEQLAALASANTRALFSLPAPRESA